MFEEWYLNELFSSNIRNTWKLLDCYLLKLIYSILEECQIINILKNGTTIDNIINNNNFPKKVYNSLKWILDRLSMDGFIDKKYLDNDYIYILTDKKMEYSLNELKNESIAIAPDTEAAFKMLKMVSDNYPDYLRGNKKGIDIIFSPDNITITNEYYTDNLFYNVHNIAGAKAVNYLTENIDEPLIIEIGGGLGGGTRQLLKQRHEENRKNKLNYFFTDISNKMIRTSRKCLSCIKDNEKFNFQKLNFNKNFEEQGFQRNSADIIWGVNSIHVADDLKFALNEIYKTLKSGGSFIISETVRASGNKMIQQELILNTIDDYWNVKLDKDIRPNHGFMHWMDWVNIFKNTGFDKVETIPDMSVVEKQYDNCYIAVVRGIKI